MQLDQIYDDAIVPALALLPVQMTSAQATVMLFAIGLQESRFVHRWQVLSGGRKGPARGFWQFEKGNNLTRGGVTGVMLHDASRYWLSVLCQARGAVFSAPSIWLRIETDDVLAAGLARLMLFTDRKPLPAITDTEGAWQYYLRCWRPGKPHSETWADNHTAAQAAALAGWRRTHE